TGYRHQLDHGLGSWSGVSTQWVHTVNARFTSVTGGVVESRADGAGSLASFGGYCALRPDLTSFASIAAGAGTMLYGRHREYAELDWGVPHAPLVLCAGGGRIEYRATFQVQSSLGAVVRTHGPLIEYHWIRFDDRVTHVASNN